MAKFFEVFSARAVLVLFLIMAGAMLILALMVAAGPGPAGLRVSPTIPAVHTPENDQQARTIEDKRHVRMPASKWKRLVAGATKYQCAVLGMNKQEVEQVLGKPAKVDASPSDAYIREIWTYSRTNPKKCERYEGDKCAEFVQEKTLVLFTPNGYQLGDAGPGCFTLPFIRFSLAFAPDAD